MLEPALAALLALAATSPSTPRVAPRLRFGLGGGAAARAVLELLRRAQDEQLGRDRHRRAARLFELDEPFLEWGEHGSRIEGR